jgi:cell division protein FtsI (penicillin-binding protein 3)
MLLLLSGLGVLLLRAVWLEVFQQDWLQKQADKRQMRVVSVPPYRGMIVDRHGEPLAVSSPVEAISCDPQKILHKREKLRQGYENSRSTGEGDDAQLAEIKYLKFEESLRTLAESLHLEKSALTKKLQAARHKHFLYLARQLEPEVAERIMELDLPTVATTQEYRRFYPMAEMVAHVVGFTDIDGRGVVGVERSMDGKLAGKPGKKRVVRDGRGRLIENIEELERMVPGLSVQLTIDRRIQYTAYKELKKQVYRLNAQSGSVVVLDAHSGEILAMANMPGFNPNNRRALKAWNYRNRAVMDSFEPGSTMKPLTIAAALNARVIDSNVNIDTSPGFLDFGNYVVRDPADLGTMSLAKILARSSNVGASKVALLTPMREHWMFLSRLGFGQAPNAGFPSEAPGSLTHYSKWVKVDHASLGYGYGLSVNLLQMAHAYSIFATGGLQYPVSIIKSDDKKIPQRILSESNANAVLHMMEAVVQPKATGKLAKVGGYRVAGKTGTAYKVINKKYRKDKRIVSFIGVAPITNPKVVVAVMLDDPKLEHTGGKAAAPVFARIMAQTLRVLDAPPDKYMEEIHQAEIHKKQEATL